MSKRFENKVAIITGSDSGIGRATAIEFAREGAAVTITYNRDEKGAKETQKEVEALGAKSVVVHLEQGDLESVRKMFRETDAKLGTPTILINNAGTGGAQERVEDVEPSEWERTIRSDLFGPFYCCKEFIARISKTGRPGVIVNVTSVHEEIPMESGSAYCVAKSGLRMLTRCLALELAEQNIRVNNLAPGMIMTPMNQEAIDDPKKYQESVQKIPMKRGGQPEEMAKAIAFLASDDASYVHGATLFADGALTQKMGG
jgi:glucose 1-dehydrogenase